MMKVFICPECGWIRTVSRRKEVECHKCSGVQMLPSRLTFVEYSRQGKGIRDFYTTEKTRREHESILVGSYGRTGGMNVPRRKT